MSLFFCIFTMPKISCKVGFLSPVLYIFSMSLQIKARVLISMSASIGNVRDDKSLCSSWGSSSTCSSIVSFSAHGSGSFLTWMVGSNTVLGLFLFFPLASTVCGEFLSSFGIKTRLTRVPPYEAMRSKKFVLSLVSSSERILIL